MLTDSKTKVPMPGDRPGCTKIRIYDFFTAAGPEDTQLTECPKHIAWGWTDDILYPLGIRHLVISLRIKGSACPIYEGIWLLILYFFTFFFVISSLTGVRFP